VTVVESPEQFAGRSRLFRFAQARPEEPGWRGFALPRLQAHYGAFWASVILAPLWAAWHLPLFWIMPGWTSASPGQFALILLGISFLLTWAANLGRFSILIAVVLHAFFNTSSGLGNALSSNLPRRSHEMWIYTLVVFMGGFACGLAFLGKRRISRRTFRLVEVRQTCR
jgi:membrane protease YdiL (CAAX protease family)